MQFTASATTKLLLLAGLACLSTPALKAQANPGDPLFCDPIEGATFLIVNGGNGIFTVNSDCFGNTPAAVSVNPNTIATSQGGTLTRGAGTSLNYVYTPPTPTFTGIDTFPYSVTTVCNRNAGGVGSSGGTSCPGGPASFTVSLNVLPSQINLPPNGASPLTITPPAGSVSSCTGGGNSGTGPVAGQVVGCTTAVTHGIGVNPTKGTLTQSGNNLIYTPGVNFLGVDTFTMQVQGVNTDGNTSLNSGNVTVTVGSAAVPALGTFGLILLSVLLLVFGAWFMMRQTAASENRS